jgi:aminotransferase
MISVFGSDIGDAEKNLVIECLDSQWIGCGKVVDQFESEFLEERNLKNFLMLDSGSNALYLAIKLLNLPKGSEVILPALTWISCANAITLAGLKPIFADVELQTMNVTAETISRVITKNTAAIMVVHFAGLPVDMDPILDFEIPIIEDAAHATYSSYKGASCGSLGTLGIYSFDSVKNLAVGEGGGITTKNEELAQKARALRYCGIKKSGFENAQGNQSSNWWEYELSEPFIKMLPTNISASIGLAQLRRQTELQSKRKKIWQRYQIGLNGISDLSLPAEASFDDQHSFFTFVIRTSRRTELAKFLLGQGIYTTLRYHALNHYADYNQLTVELEMTRILEETALSIPLHPRLSDDEVTYIIEKIREFFKVST